MRQFIAAIDPEKPSAVRLLVPRELLNPEKEARGITHGPRRKGDSGDHGAGQGTMDSPNAARGPWTPRLTVAGG